MTDFEPSFCHRYRYAVVLAATLLLALAQPLLSELMGEERSFDLLFSLLIAAVLLQVLRRRGCGGWRFRWVWQLFVAIGWDVRWAIRSGGGWWSGRS
jgi:hypothetical protein